MVSDKDMFLALPNSDKNTIEAHVHTMYGNSKSLNEWIAEAIREKIYREQEEHEKLPPARRWYRSEEGQKALEALREKAEKDDIM